MSKKIYLAIPYTHPDPAVRDERHDRVTAVTADLMSQGTLVFSPITYTHNMQKLYDMPTDWQFWQRMCCAFVSWADELWVLRLDGWKESVGVQAEIREAERQGKAVRYV